MNSEQVSEAKTMDKVAMNNREQWKQMAISWSRGTVTAADVATVYEVALPTLLADLEAAEARSARLTEALKRVEFIASEKGHAPCRCGGLGPEGVCSNTCYCDWAKEILEALAVEQPAQLGEATR